MTHLAIRNLSLKSLESSVAYLFAQFYSARSLVSDFCGVDIQGGLYRHRLTGIRVNIVLKFLDINRPDQTIGNRSMSHFKESSSDARV